MSNNRRHNDQAEYLHVMVADIPVTLRKRMTFLLTDPGKVVFAGQSMEEALLWLRENDHISVDLISPSGRWDLDFKNELSQEEAFLWLGQPHHF